MSRHHRAAAAVGLLLVVFTFHLTVVWQDIGILARNGFLYDDSFYAFQVARNIAAGHGMSFDGLHSTTGFQPLYVFMLVPVFLISGGDPVLPIYIALSLLAVCTTLTAWLVFSIARRYVGRNASLAAAAIWAFSPIVTRQTANGLETALAAGLIALVAWYYLTRVRSLTDPPARRLVVLGLLLGATVLARIDGLLLVLALLLDALLVMRRRRTGAPAVARLMLVPLGVLVCYGPWFGVNLAATGSPLQDSGAATRFLSLAYSGYFRHGAADLSQTGPDAQFLISHVEHSVATLKVIPSVHVIFRVLEKAGQILGARGAFRLAAGVLGWLLMLGAGILVARWRRDPRRAQRRELDFLLLFSLLLVLSYSLYVFGSFFFLRYYYPLYLLAGIYGAFFLQDAWDWLRVRSRTLRRAALAGVAVYAALFGYFSYSQAFRTYPIYPFYDVARWVESNTAPGETIGVFQCGMIGYFADRRIVNLDGKVNRAAHEALREGCLDDYLCREGIDVILDHSRIIEIFLGHVSRISSAACIQLPRGALPQPSGWVALRITPIAAGAGAGEETPRAILRRVR